MRKIERATINLPKSKRLARRRELIAALEPKRPLPSQALIGTAINEAVRLSVENGSKFVAFDEKFYPRLE